MAERGQMASKWPIGTQDIWRISHRSPAPWPPRPSAPCDAPWFGFVGAACWVCWVQDQDLQGRQFHSSADMDSGSIADIRITDIERSTCKRQGLPFFLRDPYGSGWREEAGFSKCCGLGADSKHKTASVFLLTLHWALQAALVKNPHWFFAIGFWCQITGSACGRHPVITWAEPLTSERSVEAHDPSAHDSRDVQ